MHLDRKQQNSIKQLSFSKKINVKKNSIKKKGNIFESVLMRWMKLEPIIE